jgi:hypothetical protein
VTPLMSLSKWFYDTSTGAATGAVPLWFPRPEVKGVVLLCLSARLRSSLFSPSVRVCGVRPPCLLSARTFYSPRPGSYRVTPWPDRWPRGW